MEGEWKASGRQMEGKWKANGRKEKIRDECTSELQSADHTEVSVHAYGYCDTYQINAICTSSSRIDAYILTIITVPLVAQRRAG